MNKLHAEIAGVYNYTIEYKQGNDHVNADALSRPKPLSRQDRTADEVSTRNVSYSIPDQVSDQQKPRPCQSKKADPIRMSFPARGKELQTYFW